MSTIFYDNQIFVLQKFGGISRYFAELMSGINSSGQFRSLPKSFYSSNDHLRLSRLTHFDWFTDMRRFRGKVRIEKLLRTREDERMIKIAEKGNYDIYHPTYYDPLYVKYVPQDKPMVVTVYDMIHEFYLKDIELPAHKKYMLFQAKRIVAISQNTKNDILKLFPEIPDNKIDVVHLGSSFPVSQSLASDSDDSKYILFVGNRWTYKNFTWFVTNVADFVIREKLTLVCAGAGAFSDQELELFEQLKISGNIRYVPINTDEELINLYRAAACFIFPSLYEGFGIPVLEAFSCGCPVLLANASCFPEIAGDAALYFDVDDPDSLVQQLSSIVNNKNVADDLRTKGYEQNKLYSWENVVKQHKEIYKSILAEPA